MSKKNDFTYCKGERCALKEHCVRYREGLNLPNGDWWWMASCGEDRDGYISDEI